MKRTPAAIAPWDRDGRQLAQSAAERMREAMDAWSDENYTKVAPPLFNSVSI